jgi:phage tail-like protein
VAKYGSSIFGTFTYGQPAKLTYSVEPISLLALSFSAIRVSWQLPQGTFSKIRLVRNQGGYAETAEDGVTVWEEAASTPSILSIDDGIDNPSVTPLVSGRMVYYRMFLFTGSSIWVPAGDANTIVPFDKETHQKLLSFLPRVFTSAEQTPLGQVSNTSDLYNFIGGLSLSIEELLSYLDLLRPRHVSIDTPVSLLPLEYGHLGLTPEFALPIKNQKRLVREALYMYSRKGTLNGLETYVESLTGYAPTITVSENKILDIQSSTFYNSTGNWTTANATLTASTAITPPTGTNVIDDLYSCQVVTTGVSYMRLGNPDPIRLGIPVDPSTEYTVSCRFRSPTSAGNVTIRTTFYDRHGIQTGSTASSSPVAADDTWKTGSVTATSSSSASYADIEVYFSAAGTYYIDQVCYQSGASVSYDEARALTIVLNATYKNLIKNPSFETNTTFWTSTGSPTITRETDVTTDAYAGTRSAKILATGSWTYTADAANITVGQYYTASVYAKTNAAMTMTLTAKDSASSTVATTSKSVNGASWSRYDLSILIPAGSAATTLSLNFSGSTGTFYIDCVQLEQSFKASEYFDGSLPDEYGVVWGGTAYNSISYRYPSRDQKIPRLTGTLNDWVPENVWWRIKTERGLEKDVLDV